MLIGNPCYFSILANVVKEWNLDESFRNGVLFFYIGGVLFPKEILNATLNCEIPQLKVKISNIAISKEIYDMEKEKAFIAMYDITFPDWDIENDYRYDISPSSFSDAGYYVFAVSNTKQIRIMAAKLNYILEESTHNLNNLEISETFITGDELNNIIHELDMLF